MADDDPPNLNTGTPWSETESRDLKWCIEHREPVEYIADSCAATRPRSLRRWPSLA